MIVREFLEKLGMKKNEIDDLNLLLVETNKVFISLVDSYQQQMVNDPNILHKIEHLANEGWFLSIPLLTLDERHELSRLEVDHLLDFAKEWYEAKFKELIDGICKEHPGRQQIIRQAAEAHQDHKYCLSVPVFFSQSDGVCAEHLKHQMFQSKDNITSLASSNLCIEPINLILLLENFVWQPLAKKRPISENTKDRQASGYAGLNRNTILHGESTDYGTEDNSLKAFSLLVHVTCAVQYYNSQQSIPSVQKQEISN